MSHLYPYRTEINLHVEGKISAADAQRQQATAKEILARLKDQPGVILADEVGMGKTFVALAVSVSVALGNRGRRPVVVMVPPSLQKKWPRDFSLFLARCVPDEMRAHLRYAAATRAEEFLKLLDDPPERKRAIIFVTHGAMSRGLSDKWVKLALIRQALRYRRDAEDLKRDLCKILGCILRFKWIDSARGPEVWAELLRTHPGQWLQVLRRWDVDPEEDENPDTDDDPVPRSLHEVLGELNTDELYAALQAIPRRQSANFDERVRLARQSIQASMKPLWGECIAKARLRLPLLVLDEAHHLKNEDTQLASLFRCEEASKDMDEVTRGALGGVFERMLFLTATPFQLGHAELCSVLERFQGIAWESRLAPGSGRDGFLQQVAAARRTLDAAQESALRLDDAWGRLRAEHLGPEDGAARDLELWWRDVQSGVGQSPEIDRVLRCYRTTHQRMRAAEGLLRPWVLRHLKARQLPDPYEGTARRAKFVGSAIRDDANGVEVQGLSVEGRSLVPFLLAARAAACSPTSRAFFAEGLASSYEAFLDTRRPARGAKGSGTDGDVDRSDCDPAAGPASAELRWYMDHLENVVPRGETSALLSHPKVSATTQRVVRAWREGEKIVVFCHYIATGKALRRAISHAVSEEIAVLGAEKLGCKSSETFGQLERLGDRFFDQDSPIRRACDAEVDRILGPFEKLAPHTTELRDAIRRVVRTPSFLVRFFPLRGGRLGEDDMLAALDAPDQSGLTLRQLLVSFFRYLECSCDERSRADFIDAVCNIQVGSHVTRIAARAYNDDELQGEDVQKLLPNVRLVNGATKQETRQRLMLAFNTPFYPEVLVASSVMAEGVDLHLNCRHVIHHDLCWNPSTLEQRTGRVDRVGAKAEQCGRSIHVYLPFVGQTQDEKMYRVVTDRERWFSVVMGDKFDLTEKATEKLAQRIPLPASVAQSLAMRLEVALPGE